MSETITQNELERAIRELSSLLSDIEDLGAHAPRVAALLFERVEFNNAGALMDEIPAGSSLDHAGIDRRTYERPNCGRTDAHGQHIHSPMKGLRINCPGAFG